ncbi:GTP-binding protein [Streptomyces sp. G-5]|uniref:GTP-binding protein n=1 Tax=Streptomyces sp. G-5 TaxID=2977231 RepID=UPI0021D28DDD|nr:ATP/GTP-binding protein [Streptomyces sp. G-5]MCU4750248.1 ATP/GTP-binding protein [Streptomyces sp. G-5]
MDSARSDTARPTYLTGTERPVKILIGGSFGVGKTTFIGSLSEIRPLRTEEKLTVASVGTDDLAGIESKTETTVAMDFGRLTLVPGRIVLYLFGAPGQERFLPVLTDLSTGALGALVLVDTRRLDAAWPVMARIEEMGLPYAVAVNQFPDTQAHSAADLRTALDLAPETPLVTCDARERESARGALVTLVEYVLTRSRNAAVVR